MPHQMPDVAVRKGCCCCCCRNDGPRSRHRRVLVRQRAAGVNLSVDVIVDGWIGNVPLPRNDGPGVRTDYFRIGGYEYGVRVQAHMPYVSDADIEYRGKV